MNSSSQIDDIILGEDSDQLTFDFDDPTLISASNLSPSNSTYTFNSGLSLNSGSVGGLGAIGSSIAGNTNPYNYNYNWNTSGATGGFTINDTITLSDWGNIQSTLDVKGDANFEGDVKLKGKSLIESLEKIEEKLAILRPNEQLEEKWDQLRELRKQYMELEKEIIEKEKMWDILKK